MVVGKFFHNYSGPYILLGKTKPTTFRVAHAHNNRPLKNEVRVNRMKRLHHRSIVPGRIQVQPDLDESVIDIEELNPGDQHRVLIEGPTTMSRTLVQRRLSPPLFPYLEADKDNIQPANIENHFTQEAVDSVTPSNKIDVPDSVATEVRPSQKEKIYEVNDIFIISVTKMDTRNIWWTGKGTLPQSKHMNHTII